MLGLALIDLKRSWWRGKAVLVANTLLSCLIALIALLYFQFIQQALIYSSLDQGMLYNYTVIMNIFGFLSFCMVSSVLLAVLANAMLSTFYIEKRMSDIATMKAHGMPESPMANMFLIQLAMLFALGSLAGFVPVLIAGMIAFQGVFPLTEQTSLLMLVHVAGNSLAIVFVTKKKMARAYMMTVADMMLDQWIRDPVSVRRVSGWHKIAHRLGPVVLYSYKSLVTRRHDARKALAIFTCSMLLCGTLLTGTAVIASTYEGLVQASLGGDDGPNTIVIGHGDVIARITDVYTSFHDQEAGMSLAGWNATEVLLDNEALDLSPIASVISNVDWRCAFPATARELKGIVLDPQNGGFIERGRNRSMDVLVFGVQFTSMFNAWNIHALPNQVILGDTTAGLLFEDPGVQRLGLGILEFQIAGMVFDTAFNGRSVYVDSSQVPAILGIAHPAYNCAFITMRDVPAGERQAIVAQVHQLAIDAFGNETMVLDMKEPLDRLASAIGVIAGIHLSLAMVAFLFVVMFTVEFTSIIVSWNKKDHEIMPALGITTRRARAMIMHQLHFILIPAATIAFSSSLIVSSLFLISDAVLPSILVPLLIFLAMTGMLSVIQYGTLILRPVTRPGAR